MVYQEYLNHKSILSCGDDKKDQERHRLDTQKMFEILADVAGHGAIVKMSYQDLAHKDKKDRYSFVGPEEYASVLECLDMKNGGDFVIQDGEIGVAVYGSNYELSGHEKYPDGHHMSETLVTYHFFDEASAKEKITICEKLDMFDELQTYELLKESYQKNDYMDTEDLKNKLRSVKRPSLDEQIELAGKEIEEKSNEKRKYRKRGKKKENERI